MDSLSILAWSEIGPMGVVTIFVFLIGFGYLLPRWIHVERIKDKDDQITYLRAILDKRDEQLVKVLENNELAARALEDLKRVAHGVVK